MGLPHVLVRFYTNPDGRDTRRTALIVIGLLVGLLPVAHAVRRLRAPLSRPELAGGPSPTRRSSCCPNGCCPACPVSCSAAWSPPAAFAAFLSTASGLTVSVAGVLSQDLLRGPAGTSGSGGSGRVRVVAIGVPYLLSLSGVRISVAAMVGLAFALAACTFCPLLVLGIWWRGLTDVGALAGLVTGGLLAGAAVLVTLLRPPAAAGRAPCWPSRPPGSCPLTFAVMIAGFAGHPRGGCRPTSDGCSSALHAPESMSADLPSLDRSAR